MADLSSFYFMVCGEPKCIALSAEKQSSEFLFKKLHLQHNLSTKKKKSINNDSNEFFWTTLKKFKMHIKGEGHRVCLIPVASNALMLIERKCAERLTNQRHESQQFPFKFH